MIKEGREFSTFFSDHLTFHVISLWTDRKCIEIQCYRQIQYIIHNLTSFIFEEDTRSILREEEEEMRGSKEKRPNATFVYGMMDHKWGYHLRFSVLTMFSNLYPQSISLGK